MAFVPSGYALALANATYQTLPSPWTEHVSPSGYLYYYNSFTLESTYNRPFSLTALLPKSTTQKPKKRKEKPAKKTAVPGSPWLRVLTTRGNIFYANTETRESTWEMPIEIEDAVEVLEAEEAAELEDAKASAAVVSDALEAAEMDAASGSPAGTKRKVRDDDGGEKRAGKRVRKEVEPTIGVEEECDEEEEEDEEAWQRKLAEEMADEGVQDEYERDIPTENEDEEKIGEDVPAIPSMPLHEAIQLFKTILQEKQVNPMHPWETSLPLVTSDERYPSLETSLSLPSQRDIFEEYCKDVLKERKSAKELTSAATTGSAYDGYRQLLKETVTSTRMMYTQFRQQVKKERKFYSYGRDEKEREREFRTYLKELGEIKKNERKKAEEAFLLMLKEGKSTRRGGGTSKKWNDVKKEFQKDSRYDAVGSSTLREELYETFLQSLKEDEAPKEVEEGEATVDTHSGGKVKSAVEGTSVGDDEKKRRRERAVKEREERVRLEKERMERQNARSRAGLNQEEAELAFNSLLVDTIRDPTISFPSAMQYLSSDPRFTTLSQASSTTMTQPRLATLFNTHIAHLQSKGNTVLYTLFESHAPGLDMRWDALPAVVKSSIAGSAVVKRLGVDAKVSSSRRPRNGSEEEEEEEERVEYPALRHEFERWQRQRFTDARTAFDTMLSENAFVEFWGRVGKMGLTDQEEKARLGKMVFAGESGGIGGVGGMDMDVDEEGDDAGAGEGEGGGGKRDLQALAKGIDVKEVERVLRRDKRFVVFDYMQQEREEWLRDYLRGLSAPKASVHVG